MINRFQLPGETEVLSTPVQSGSITRMLITLLFLLCISGGGYYLIHYRALGTSRSDPSNRTSVPAHSVPMSQAEDLLHHLDAADKNALKAVEEMKRSQEWIRRTLPSIDAEHLSMERQRLTSASVSSDAARRALEEVRVDINILKNALSEGVTNETK